MNHAAEVADVVRDDALWTVTALFVFATLIMMALGALFWVASVPSMIAGPSVPAPPAYPPPPSYPKYTTSIVDDGAQQALQARLEDQWVRDREGVNRLQRDLDIDWKNHG